MSADVSLRELYADLRGDGVEGWHYTGPHLDTIRGIEVTPQRAGTFEFEMTAWTMLGCSDRTGLRRVLTVTR